MRLLMQLWPIFRSTGFRVPEGTVKSPAWTLPLCNKKVREQLGCNSSFFWHLKEQDPHCFLSSSGKNSKKSEENSCLLTDNPGLQLAKPHVVIINHHGRTKTRNLLNRSQSLKTNTSGTNLHHMHRCLDIEFLLRPSNNIKTSFCSFSYLFFN